MQFLIAPQETGTRMQLDCKCIFNYIAVDHEWQTVPAQDTLSPKTKCAPSINCSLP